MRRLQKTDIPRLLELIHTYKSAGSTAHPLPEAQIKSTLEEALTREHSWLYVYAPGGEAAWGFINFHLLPFPLILGRELYISDLLVAEEKRGQGVGSQLLRYAEAFARERGCVRLMLNNLKDSAAYSRGFYARQGFTERTGIANFVKRIEPPGGQG